MIGITGSLIWSKTLMELIFNFCSFSKLSVNSPMSQLILILQSFRHFTYVTAHSPTLPSLYLRHNSFSNLSVLHLRHSSFSNPSVALPTSNLILQSFRRFTYVTAHSPTLLSLLLCHRIFTYVTWRATHEANISLLFVHP